ncbi:MAG: hypothetical protein UY72_C0048G0008 [Candidatus Uhrbacteria bacterium GW2011_GWD2_52_7]|uniref:tRNA-dihydrouridine synthase n=1 Tax=Candidatus Uhrbacteria bacterium GW2011_GWD2_52_7 TaxID=1618989 RepID=A0A0G1XEG6_9BACT|nr:MAG: hypothetical protein UY72_C0048G0008 [Candidatus Uhrbacteria bacterium GW2011_GWD2_52_7]
MQLDWRQLPRPIIALSPMADMTDSAFCRVVRAVSETEDGSCRRIYPLSARRRGPQSDATRPLSYPIMFREMVSSEAVVRGNNKTLDMTEIHPDERPLVQQIFGSDPATMAEAARIIEAQHHPEGFDINMGCPVYKIVHNFNGAALMKEPQLAAQIVREMKKAITVPLSVKIRLGWSEPTEALEFAKVLEDAGADALTVHGRTKAQGYSGVADWHMVGEVKKRVALPVLVNGDVHQAALIPKALEASGCDGVLIARGALGNPWIFKQFNDIAAGKTPDEISLEERLRVVRLHLNLHLEQYGEHAVNTFRKHLSWYFKGIPGFKRLRERMMTAKTKDELLLVLEEIQTPQAAIA